MSVVLDSAGIDYHVLLAANAIQQCLDVPELQPEFLCQLAKQTSRVMSPGATTGASSQSQSSGVQVTSCSALSASRRAAANPASSTNTKQTKRVSCLIQLLFSFAYFNTVFVCILSCLACYIFTVTVKTRMDERFSDLGHEGVSFFTCFTLPQYRICISRKSKGGW